MITALITIGAIIGYFIIACIAFGFASTKYRADDAFFCGVFWPIFGAVAIVVVSAIQLSKFGKYLGKNKE